MSPGAMEHHRAGPDDSRGRAAPGRPGVLVLDVNETLSDLSPMATRFQEVGAPGSLAKTWFASVLRDGFALTAVAGSSPFATVAAEQLRALLHGVQLDRGLDEAVAFVMDGFSRLQVHQDVPDGVQALRELGIRLVTLSNGAATVAEELLDRAGVRDHFEQVLSVEDAGIWKPAGAAYGYALEQCEVHPADAMLVAVHPWDIDGASRAGLRTAWVTRTGGPYPAYFAAPDLRVASLEELARLLR